jgi:hypothetical protein
MVSAEQLRLHQNVNTQLNSDLFTRITSCIFQFKRGLVGPTGCGGIGTA